MFTPTKKQHWGGAAWHCCIGKCAARFARRGLTVLSQVI
ncbi:hypothetical protein PULV_b0194 [Pseudoalteromonas ulvae UL12]|nr:hypothetical protein [Pseudoalteromonas ulvae UL12]